MNIEKLISESLNLAPSAILYSVSQHLKTLFPNKAMLETDSGLFDVETYAQAGLCTLTPKPLVFNQLESYWQEIEQRLNHTARNAWFEVRWQGHGLDLLVMCCNGDYHYWVLADIGEIVETFFRAVWEWNSEVRGEVLVFEGGCWSKDEELFKAIQSSTFDNLVLPPHLQKAIYEDARQFFASRATYEEYNIPWKRGVLLVGPPGNGKTHAVKALINSLKMPCLYVKSFRNRSGIDENGIRAVFGRARKTAPCLLVFEDLDALITNQNRSFFLNELDGFAWNTGILTVATTNHPEKLDEAIVNRPSRFDRKYHFDLPALPQRLAYIEQWNKALKLAMRMTPTEIEEVSKLTEGFSFAYLKELFVSTLVDWVNWREAATVGEVMAMQADLLRKQMITTNTSRGKQN